MQVKNKIQVRLLILIALFSISISSNAQLHLFGGPGISFYQGDVDAGAPPLKTIKFSWKAGVGYDFHPRWGARLHYSKAGLHGSDSYSNETAFQARGITFSTKVTDIGLTAKYKYLFKKSYRFMNYGFFGFDYMSMAVARNLTGTAALIPEDAYSNTQFNIPVGLGLGWWFNAHWGIVSESAYHYALTDYLDGTSNSGNPKANDSYIDVHVMVIYRFGGGKTGSSGLFDGSKLNNVDCPKWGY
ncbi:MAG: OOP family OmpA-OmpF porin [Saprospiraceae bacterium]